METSKGHLETCAAASPWLPWIAGAVSVLGIFLWASLTAMPWGEAVTRCSVRISLIWYFCSLGMMILAVPADWNFQTVFGQWMRWCWTWAAIIFVIHVALAFHYYHGWSHLDAWRRTDEISGYGNGLYVSYAFTVIWAGEASLWWWRPEWVGQRSIAWDRWLHALMLFIVFNGMVVFGMGATRWLGAGVFAALPVLMWVSPTLRRHRVANRKCRAVSATNEET